MLREAGLAVLRITIGLIFAAHGAQKAFGWWNGPGYAGWTSVITKMGFRPTAFWTWGAGLGQRDGQSASHGVGSELPGVLRWPERLIAHYLHTIATPTARTNGRFVPRVKTYGTPSEAHVESGMRYHDICEPRF